MVEKQENVIIYIFLEIYVCTVIVEYDSYRLKQSHRNNKYYGNFLCGKKVGL